MRNKQSILAVIAVLLLISAVRPVLAAPGGKRHAPPAVTGPMILNWNACAVRANGSIVELQIFRDAGTPGRPGPFYVVSDPVALAQGYVDLAPLYSSIWSGVARTVDYHVISRGGSLVSMSSGWTVESYGATHTYRIRAIIKKQMGKKIRYSYTTAGFRGPVTMTCIEPITADPAHIVSPWNGDSVLVTDLREGVENLSWSMTMGATEYQVSVQPVDPDLGPTWHSSIIYDCPEPGAVLALGDSDRLVLAAMLANPQYVDKDMEWRVDVRNSADTGGYWTQGEWSIFHVAATPPPF